MIINIYAHCMYEEFVDTKGVIKIHKSKKDGQYNGQKKRTKGQTTIYKTLNIN
jgi:hypothetical protein